MHAHHCTICAEKDATIAQLNEENAALRWEDELHMLNRAGLKHAIRTLNPDTTYTIVFADIDRLKVLNSATCNHIQTNRYLRAGLAVRAGEIAGQFLGDEFLFLIDEHGPSGDRRYHDSASAFVARIARQLAGQPLTISERYALAAAQQCHVSEAKLSATFATQSGVTAAQVLAAVEQLSCQVLAQKAERDLAVRVV